MQKGQGMEVAKLKQTIKELKQDLYTEKESSKSDKDKLKELEKDKEQLKGVVVEKDRTISDLEKNIDSLKNDIHFKKGQLYHFKNESKKRQNIINGLKSEKWSRCEDTIKDLEKEVAKYKRENEKLLIENRDLINKAQKLTIVEALNLLNSMLSMNTVKHYAYVYDKLVRRVTKLREKQLHQSISSIVKSVDVELEELLGYIEVVNDDVVFFSLDGDMYTVDETFTAIKNLDARVGQPCKVGVLEDGSVKVSAMYICDATMKYANRDNKKLRKSSNKVREEYGFKYSNNLNIAIIGTNVKSEYVNALQKVGLSCVWMNSRDLRRDKIASDIKKFDITVVLNDECSNSVTKVLDNEEYNILYISKDTVNHLLSYLNVEIHRLGLAEIINTSNTVTEQVIDCD